MNTAAFGRGVFLSELKVIVVVKIVQHGCAYDYRVSDDAEPVRDLAQNDQAEQSRKDYR